ncbi:hypothetical protein LTR91_009388 [Friedmanniomyces endolithicus]|uniref:Protein ARV n=1 Tax=Friedmanniomyces endolithicus TaxID=329885 RepID=A0AAN6QT57_9PEZI|nr:hypothetical protein LTR35_002436 [Friedmanniomyces endolithicus]KAK0984399.1 hypothetical protein LTS01_010617 [Friedmanniomyces endolithicus]KAK0988866.1 hypothetical protein LTR91_009388 [Friedmanniomyces endolithicus]KAK1049460.1 hypothetical protein LTS16_003737 [Friedmanniomyces endolithicus]
MPICIECRFPVPILYTTYSKADDKALGKGVRLTQCPRCKRFADKYVEHDFVVLFIDLVLIKPQVYRHLLFNHWGRDDKRFDPSIIRFGILLLLFDVYLTWARIEKDTPGLPLPPLPPILGSHDTSTTSLNSTLSSSISKDAGITIFLATQPVLLQYLFFLLLCTAENLAFHLPIRTLLSLSPTILNKTAGKLDTNSAHPSPSLISTALLISSFPKLFPLLLLIWPYDLPSSASAVSWAVIVNNIAALEILLGCGDFYGGARVDGDEYGQHRRALGESDGMELMA